MQFFFYQNTTGIVLLSVAVSVWIYRDMYRVTLHVSRYVSYRMTAVSSQPYNLVDFFLPKAYFNWAKPFFDKVFWKF